MRTALVRRIVTDERARAALDALDGIVGRVLSEASLAEGAPERFSWTSDGFGMEGCDEFADKVTLRGDVFWEFGEIKEYFVLDVARREEPFLYSVKFFGERRRDQRLYVGRDLRGWVVSDD